MDIATLGLEVRSDQVKKGTASLDRLSLAASRAQAAAMGVATGSRQAAAGSASNAAGALDREAAAARRAQQALERQATASRAANDNARRMGGSMSGLAAQFQDIGVTAAMGMNPAVIALQQGTQIACQMEFAMQGGAKVTDVLGTAFRSLFSPLTFITIALSAQVLLWMVSMAPASPVTRPAGGPRHSLGLGQVRAIIAREKTSRTMKSPWRSKARPMNWRLPNCSNRGRRHRS